MSDLSIIIMAGGLGKRMNSEIPKVLHKVNGKPMLVRVLDTSLQINPEKILIVVGKYKDIIKNTIEKYISLKNIEFINQLNANGTGDAIKCCKKSLLNNISNKVLILSGDVPLVSKETMYNSLKNLNKCKIVVTKISDPKGLGRVIVKNDKCIKIVEDKDCNTIEKKINLINTGIYAFDKYILCKNIDYINNNNAQQEYYLTDIIEIIKNNEKIDIDMYEISKDKQYELTGVNTQQQLIELNNLIKIKND